MALADAGVAFYAQPCSSDPASLLGSLNKGDSLDVTGRASPSACGDGLCWLEATAGGALVWIPDHACGATDSLLGSPAA